MVPVLFTFYVQGVLKLKKNNSGSKRLSTRSQIPCCGYFKPIKMLSKEGQLARVFSKLKRLQRMKRVSGVVKIITYKFWLVAVPIRTAEAARTKYRGPTMLHIFFLCFSTVSNRIRLWFVVLIALAATFVSLIFSYPNLPFRNNCRQLSNSARCSAWQCP